MKIRLSTLLTASSLLIIGLLSQCKNPLEGVVIAVNTQVFNYEANIQVFDPVDQSNLDGTDALNIEVLGENADWVVNNAGEKNFAAFNGIVALALTENSLTSSAKFVVKVSGENYLTTTIPVTIDPEDSVINISSFLVNTTTPPDGVGVNTESALLSDGKTTTEVLVETESSASSSTNVIIDAGTSFLDADGQPILGSNLEVQVANFDSQTSEALESFPGGFTPLEVIDENGDSQADISFITAGFTSIDMYVGDKEVKGFTEPIEIAMKVNSDFVNPLDGQPLNIGDKIPVWSYSDDDGTWEYHTEGVVSQGDNGLEVRYSTTHLSWYNLDFYGRNCYYATSTVSVSMPGVTSSDGYRMYSDIVYAGTNQPISYWSGKTTTWYDGKTFNYYNAPSNVNVQVVVYSGSSRYRKGELLYRSASFQLCNGSGITIPASQFVDKLPKLQNVTVDYTGYCGENIVEPSTSLYMKDPSYGYWRYMGYVNKGRIVLYNVVVGQTYQFAVIYNNRVYYHDLNLTSTNMVDDNYVIPDSFCDKFF